MGGRQICVWDWQSQSKERHFSIPRISSCHLWCLPRVSVQSGRQLHHLWRSSEPDYQGYVTCIWFEMAYSWLTGPHATQGMSTVCPSQLWPGMKTMLLTGSGSLFHKREKVDLKSAVIVFVLIYTALYRYLILQVLHQSLFFTSSWTELFSCLPGCIIELLWQVNSTFMKNPLNCEKVSTASLLPP